MVLGAVSEGLEGFQEIATAARSIAACDWQPTADIVAAAVTRAVADGDLIRQEAPDPATAPRFALSTAGKAHLCALLDRPSPRCRDSVGRTITALKVCFLGALDPARGCAVLETLSAGYRCELQVLRKGCRSCPVGRGYARLWIDREVQRIEQEVAWLEGLRANLTVNTPSQQGGS